ncbi:MAG TPA: hypothetical protein VGK47_14965 [Nitrososphaeraceae archaeon]
MTKCKPYEILLQRLNELNIPICHSHSFDTSLAEHLGLEIAIIINLLALIYIHPEDDSEYNNLSLKEKLLLNIRYMTEEKINISLKKMESLGLISWEESNE